MRRPVASILSLALLGVGLAATPAQAATTLPVAGVTASSHDGNVPANAIDGDLNTRWSAEGDGSWIRFDLGASTTVGSIAIAWHQGDTRVQTFAVQVSADAATWNTVVSQRTSSGSTLQLETYGFTDRTARYVRVLGYGNTYNDWNSITEARVYGADGSGGTCAVPADVLDLTNWKITLPIGASESPTEIKQPTLDSYQISPWFVTADSCRAVQFRAPVNGVTTSGSSYPRSELREMTSNGTANAAWSSTSGTHTLTVDLAFTRLPATKPHVVGAQIHDGSDDVTVFRLEGTNLYVTNGDTTHHKLVTSGYQLGTRIQVKFVVGGGQVRAYYNGVLQTTLSRSFSGAYFKAGAYTQANCTNSSPCSSDNYGQTLIYGLSVTHS
ncbi:polysaccharide lyase family 7 protein [Micromonospora inyonensis]|uniref:F5/8 type C domain-containing protein n=1 Tax=Micromonospora inyonensis TaxID=47866 RepID=A0A1C6RJJ2_9ACTN|nr:polysaccharide lyase family 7 protein [Micromonospora inyonensis]SCL17366.1 F5/8 type C domain-containing protein [Micromonospora inyonensis]